MGRGRPAYVPGYNMTSVGDEAWQLDAACRNVDPDLFFPERGEPSDPAKAVCMGCPVIDACLAYAMRNHPLQGVWGGTSDKQRRRMVRRDKAMAVTA